MCELFAIVGKSAYEVRKIEVLWDKNIVKCIFPPTLVDFF